MSQNRIVVKYHNRRMLSTVDLNALFRALFDVYGEGMTVEFVAMDARERSESSAEVRGMRMVQERFQIFEMRQPSEMLRRTDIEQTAIAIGFK